MGNEKLKKLLWSAVYSLIALALAFAKVGECAPFVSAFFYASFFAKINPFFAIAVNGICSLFFCGDELVRNWAIISLLPFLNLSGPRQFPLAE